MSLIDEIKSQVKKSGTNKSKFVYFKAAAKVRVRFLQDMEDGMSVSMHDSFAASVNVPCQTLFDRECKYCDDTDLRTRNQFIWSVWDYEAAEVKLMMGPVNNASPIPALVAMYDTYGTLLDRDYVITKNGQGPTTTYSVVPMDKAKFKNDKAKPLSPTKVLQLLDKAFPSDSEDEEPAKKSKAKAKAKPVEDDEDETDDWDEVDYSTMSAKELYEVCVEKGIEVEKKKSSAYYIKQIEMFVPEEEDSDDEEW